MVGHNLKGRQSAMLDTFSGTLTLPQPNDIPEGGSPRNTNCDFSVGSVFTRSGLANHFTYAGNSAGPSAGASAVDTPLGGSTWNNPGNALVNTGVYAGNVLANLALNIATVEVVRQLHPAAFILEVTFASAPPAIVAGQVYTFAGLTSYPALNGQVVTPAFVSGNTVTFANAMVSGTYGPASDTGTASVSSIVVPSDGLDIKQFGFSLPSSATPQGFVVAIKGYASAACTLSVQMLKAGAPVGNAESVALNVGSPTTVTLGGTNDLFGGAWTYADLNNTTFGLRITVSASAPCTAFVGYTTLTAYFTPTQENFDYITTFEDSFGVIRNVALDAAGEFWVENLSTNPGVLSPLFSGPPSNSFAVSFTADSRQYFAISDLTKGNYPPQQYTGQWNDRVSQVGPGAPPTFTGIQASSTSFPIATITQPVPGPFNTGFANAYGLQSTGPGSTSPGNVVTIYYSDSTTAPEDAALVAAFNSGQPVYLYLQMNNQAAPLTTPIVVQVTSVGQGSPPGQPRQFYYFTYNAPSVGYVLSTLGGGYQVKYQQSLATMTTSVPVPGLTVGNTVTIAGSSVSAWDATWTITQALNSGAFTITQTSVTSGVATFDYTLISGVAPVVGQLVTITGTDNANGALNVVNATVASVGTGFFTVNIPVANASPVAEQGQASTAGTVFTFDPGAAQVGGTTDPIFGNATGGTLTFAGNGQFITAGTRKGTVFFITRNGYYTAPAPPVTFTIPSNTVSIQATNLPIGPPNVIARAIVFTEGGPFGVPGASFYTIPEPVEYIVSGTTYTASSLFVNDNTSTQATFSFPDSVLLAATEIDIQGNDLFNLGELGDAAWCSQYAGRTVWGRVRNKIQNFLNLTFDGGYLANPGGNLLPLGWNLNQSTTASGSPTLLVSPVFGNSFYIQNNTGSTQAAFSMIYQSAYENADLVAILQNQTAYSVRVTCRTPGSGTNGSLVIDLTPFDVGTGFGNTLGSFTLPLAQMSSTMATYQGTLLTTGTLNIPPDLQLRVWAQNITAGEDLEIDRIEIFPTQAPTNLTGVTFSYANDPESFDLVTGGNDTSTVNAQPANGAFQMHNTLYIVKESSLGFFKDTPNQEPANWQPYEEVSNVAGACGINAFDVGEEWAVMGCQNGLFLFNGGQPMPCQLEINDIWQAINWAAGASICIRNDVANRKILCAIPLPTPNPWMTDATVNANPTTPNVILALDYKGIGTIDELMAAMSMHVTMVGKLAVHDLRRKWSLWRIPTPYIGGQVKRGELYTEMFYCNGVGSSKIYNLDGPQGFDDSVPFTSAYCTYGFADANKAAENPIFGMHNKRFSNGDILVTGSGTASLTHYQNTLAAPYPFVLPGGVTLAADAANDYEYGLNEFSMRMFCEIAITGGWFNLSRWTLTGAADKWAPIRGVTQ